MTDKPDEPELRPETIAPDSLKKQAENRSGRFPPGCSGNPSGRPKGSRNKTTRMVEELLAGEAEGITRKLIERAKAGSVEALKIAMDRLLPARRDPAVEFELPPIETLDDLPAALHAVLQAVADGELTTTEGAAVAAIINSRAQAVEITKLAERIAAIEETKGGTP